MEKGKFLGGQLTVYSGGTGSALLFIHGFPFDHALWQQTAEPLLESYRIIVPDLRGFGESQPPEKKAFEMSDFADDLARLLDEMKIERVVICGLSMGGYIAMQFLKKYPEKLAGLILCDTKTAADTPEAAAGRRRLSERIFETGSEPLTAGIPMLLSPETIEKAPEKAEFLRAMMLRQCPSGIAAAALGMANRADTTAFLEEVKVPALVICGSDDKLSSSQLMRNLASRLPKAEFIEIQGAGHLVPLEKPTEMSAILDRFMKKIENLEKKI